MQESPKEVSPKEVKMELEASSEVKTGPVTKPVPVMENPAEQVLCFPTALLPCVGEFKDCGIWSGLLQSAESAFKTIMTSGELAFLDRPIAEVSEDYVQLIPYCVILRGREIFRYRRKGSEGRLTGLLSVGVGGHINPIDGDVPDERMYYKALRRELLEEVGHDIGEVKPVPLGIIYDPSNAVGKVHVGVVHVINIKPGSMLQTTDPALAAGDFWPISELTFNLKAEPFLYETWTQLVLRHVFS